MRPVVLAILLASQFTVGCAAGRLPGAPSLDVIVKSSLTADSNSARHVRAATGCDAEAVRPLAAGATLFRLWPTQKAPDVHACMRKIRNMHGVQYAEPDSIMKAQ